MARRRSGSLPVSSESKKPRCDTDDNRICNLPDSILGHILSLVPTKNAVATGILSKRWKFLWTLVVNLDFCCPRNYTGDVQHFVQFVNYVLLHHKPGYLNRLSLTWLTGCIPFYVNAWISTALARDVSELFVCARISTLPIQVRTCMFSSERLQSLQLIGSFFISSEIVFSLPRLERLWLIGAYFQSEKAFCKLLDGCPVLKYLCINMDLAKMVRHGHINLTDGIAVNVDGSEFKCMISSAILTHLDLFVDVTDTLPSPKSFCSVELDAPSLHYINLKGYIHSIFIQQKSLALLDEAKILLHCFVSEEPDYGNSIVEAVCAFGCAKTLSLGDQVLRSLSFATIKMCARFNGLTRLELFVGWNHWSSLQDFIELADNLEVLIVDEDYQFLTGQPHFNNSIWKNPAVIPRCLANCLRTVSIDAYGGCPDELAMVDYILKHGSVLQVVQIYFDPFINDDFRRKYELVQEICAVTRKSPTCAVKFHDYGSVRNAL